MNSRSSDLPFKLITPTLNTFDVPSGIVTAEELIAKNPSIVYECAALSADIYDVGKKGRKPLPPGWELLVYKEYNSSYAGACYVKNPANPTHVVYASRGTVPELSHVIDFIDDLVVMINGIPLMHYFSLINFYTLAGTKLTEKYGHQLRKAQPINTGHSLGAALADLSGTLGNYSPTITFENPGTHKMIKDAYKRTGVDKAHLETIMNVLNTTCRTYQAGVNIINACNKQLGRAFRIQDLTYDLPKEVGELDYPISPSYLKNIFYLTHYLLDQHSIAKIVDKLSSPYKVKEISNPIGFQASYIDYLDKSHEVYWKRYFNIIWDNNPGKSPKLHDSFIQYCFNELEKTQKEAMGTKLTIEKQPSLLNNSSTLFSSKIKQDDDLLKSFVIFENKDSSFIEQQEPVARCTIL